MKRLLFLLMITLSVGTIVAQPKKSRVQQTQQAQQAKKQGSSSSMTSRMQISYPVALDVPEEVVWRRDLYREIDLTTEGAATFGNVLSRIHEALVRRWGEYIDGNVPSPL